MHQCLLHVCSCTTTIREVHIIQSQVAKYFANICYPTSLHHAMNNIKIRSSQREQTSLAKGDHYSRIAHCIMCMKGCEATRRQQCYYALHCIVCLGFEILTNPKSSGSLPAPQFGHATATMFFAHLLMLEDPTHHPKLNKFFIVLTKSPP